MTPSKNIIALIVALVVLSAAAFAGGFQLNEQGARAMAQAGAFAARATDGSAIYFNPAGLGFQTEGDLYLGATMIIPHNSFYGPLQDNTNAKTEMVKQTFFPINGYVSYPVWDKLVAGIGVYNAFGLGTEWPSDWAGRFISQKASLMTFWFTPTIGYKLTEDLSIGVGASYVTGSVKLTRDVSITSLAVPTDPQVTLDMSGHGFGWNVGALYKFTPELSAGASYRSKVKVDASGSASFTPDYAVLQLPQGDVSASLTLPPTGFFGVAYKVMKNLELEADYQYIGWSTYDQLAINFAADASKNTITPKNYKDTWMIRFGGEYTMAPYHFRAGYLYDHSPVDLAYVDPILPDASRNGINVGIGYDITEKISVDAAYFFLIFDSRTVNNSIPQTSFDGTYNAYANLIGLDLEVKF